MAFTNFGSASTFGVDNDNDCIWRALIQPSLDEIPEGALITKATLTLTCVDAGNPFGVYYVDEAWTEGSVDWNSQPAVGELVLTIDRSVLAIEPHVPFGWHIEQTQEVQERGLA